MLKNIKIKNPNIMTIEEKTFIISENFSLNTNIDLKNYSYLKFISKNDDRFSNLYKYITSELNLTALEKIFTILKIISNNIDIDNLKLNSLKNEYVEFILYIDAFHTNIPLWKDVFKYLNNIDDFNNYIYTLIIEDIDTISENIYKHLDYYIYYNLVDCDAIIKSNLSNNNLLFDIELAKSLNLKTFRFKYNEHIVFNIKTNEIDKDTILKEIKDSLLSNIRYLINNRES